MTSYKHIALVVVGSILLIVALGFLTGQSKSSDSLLLTENSAEFQAPLSIEEQKVKNPANVNIMNPIANIKTNQGLIRIELFADTMPVTAGNFAKLVNEGFYNGTKFHRVIDGFMVQGGDPNSKTEDETIYGTGGPGYAIADEHVAGELLSNTRGTISMANSGPNSGGSQFFINLADNIALDFDKQPLSSKHPVFGRVIEGMDIVDAIGKVPINQRDLPINPVIVESITIE